MATKWDEVRVLGKVVSCAFDPYRPLMVHLFVTRRCNLACGYCYEADRTSDPVPIADLKRHIDHLHRLRAVLVTITGGEPLLHPQIVDLVAYVRSRGQVPVMNTNGYLLTEERVRALDNAGLYALQISVDTLRPNSITRKSLVPLLPKLRMLSEHASFRVRINTVLGAGPPDDALRIAEAAVALGFDAKCSLARDRRGAVMPLSASARRACDAIRQLRGRAPSYLSEDFQLSLADSGEVAWKCRSGARYFAVCEKGLVHLCESSHGDPGIPLAKYTEADIRRAFHTAKSCSKTCAVAYAHQASRIDAWRSQSAKERQILKRSWSDVTRELPPLWP
ncbi:MAG: radical SAM protein [Deltaproteobacteria bacterium]|nr:radical SAM protein [Deltaproteobacteria bacterium]